MGRDVVDDENPLRGQDSSSYGLRALAGREPLLFSSVPGRVVAEAGRRRDFQTGKRKADSYSTRTATFDGNTEESSSLGFAYFADARSSLTLLLSLLETGSPADFRGRANGRRILSRQQHNRRQADFHAA